MTMSEQRTLPAAVREAARARPERGLTLFDGRGRNPQRRSYLEVIETAEASAGRLQRLGVAPGEVVVVALPTSWGWCDAWLGALLAGALPVAVAPAPMLGSGDFHVARIADIAEHLGARLVVATDGMARALSERWGSGGPQALAPAELDAVEPRDPTVPESDPEATAFLQLTSGSTGLPRAVMISHRSLQHQLGALDLVTTAPSGEPAHRALDVTVSWLPLYHDMGLNGGFFYGLLNGIDLWLYPPQAFAARPELWLQSLGAHGISLATAPNFGYQLCVERVSPEKAAKLDLRSWSAALTGAEMIRPETLDAFEARFAGSGFDRRAFRPCYGMAEATLAVTMDVAGEGPRRRPLPKGAQQGLGLESVVSTGPPVPDTEVRITAPDGRSLAEGEVGEVCIRGPGVCLGYHGDPEATAATLRDGWLHTGDLGFSHAGELFLTGRLKDLLIIRGQNVMPHQLEWLAEGAADAGGSRRAGAFSLSRDAAGEEAVVVLEIEGRDPGALSGLADEIRSRIGRTLALPVADVVFVRRGQIPKTTSGKVRRGVLRSCYLDGTLERVPH